MVEHVGQEPRRAVDDLFGANTGAAADDGERRHIFRVAVDGGAPVAADARARPGVDAGRRRRRCTSPSSRPAPSGRRRHRAGPAWPAAQKRDIEAHASAADFPGRHADHAQAGDLHRRRRPDRARTVVPAPAAVAQAKPGVIFVHGGPPRQMLLGWHYMDYYSNAYAMNQYLAAHGFVVLSVNYRLGIGYGRAFSIPHMPGRRAPPNTRTCSPGRVSCRQLPGVDPKRIGIWGGSYGGYLTALALARNSDIFKAGVDLHGVHDWSRDLARDLPSRMPRYEKGDRDQAMATALKSSPDADVANWRSPVLLIQGDDDRNVQLPTDRRSRPPAGGAPRSLRGTGHPQRDPRLPAPPGLADGGHRDGGVPRKATCPLIPFSPCGRRWPARSGRMRGRREPSG